jgi:hypothetical protein
MANAHDPAPQLDELRRLAQAAEAHPATNAARRALAQPDPCAELVVASKHLADLIETQQRGDEREPTYEQVAAAVNGIRSALAKYEAKGGLD